MDGAQLFVTLIGAGGLGAVLLAITNGVIKWVNGSASRERTRNTDLLSQRTHAIEERNQAVRDRDAEAVKRRLIEEYASALRRQLIENGLAPGAWPDLEKTLTPAQLKRLSKPMKKKE